MRKDGVNAGARLDRLPIGGFHRRILWLIAAGMFFDSFDIYLAGGVLGALVKSGWSDFNANANFISMTFVGMVIGAFAAGILGDRFGRRFTYQSNLAIMGLASLAGAAAPSMAWLIACRFVMGIGLGAEIVVGYATLTEFIPPAQRGRWAGYLSLITNSALFVSTLLGYIILPELGWRWMFVIAGLGALGVWYLRKAMPESPRWLEANGREGEAEAILAPLEAAASRTQNLPPLAAKPVPAAFGGIASLFAPPLLGRTVIGIVINVTLGFVIYGFVAWVPTFLVTQGLSIASSLGYTTIMALGGPVGAALGIALADRIGRKNGIAIVSLCAAALGIAYAHGGPDLLVAAIGFALFATIYLLVTLGVAVYVPEQFPTEYRLRATGICSTAGRLATIGVPYSVVALYHLGGVVVVLALLVGLLIMLSAAVARFGIETRNRPLEALAPTGAGAA